MGIFNRKKKVKQEEMSEEIKKQNPESTVSSESPDSQMSEFDADIHALLNRPDIQCRQDICEAEFSKAQKLLDENTSDTIHRAYDLMGNLANQFDYLPAIMWMGDFVEYAMKDLPQAAYWYQRAAELGDGNGARCYADMLASGNGVEQNFPLAMHYYADAADKGVPEAAFVVGEYLRSTGDRENAMKAYQQALRGGYEPAQTRIAQMKSGKI